FTDLTGLELDRYEPATDGELGTAGSAPALFEPNGQLRLNQVDGAAEAPDAPDTPDEPITTSLAAAVERYPELVERHLGTVVAQDDPFVARNDAGWTGGLFVYVPPGKRLEAPVLPSAVQAGAYAGRGRQHLDFDTTQEHAAPNTTSDLAFRGVLAGRATAVWKGMIRVDPGAQQTDAFQESRNLLLSKRAHADAIPGLEIEANDVRCTHAAAIAQVDREQVFYLM